MAFIIPNAANTSVSGKFIAIDQSEPDSIDFEILGNTANSGVVSGCAVSLGATLNTVTVQSGKAVIDGVACSVPAGTLSINTTGQVRFSLIVARLVSGSPVLTVLDGTQSLGNPVYPNSTNTMVSASGNEVDFSTDIVLAAVYMVTGQNLSAKSIVDKRTFIKNTISNQGTTAPSVGSGLVGELYFSPNQTLGTNSGLYVRGSAGWIPLQQNVGPQLPVGAVIAWPSSTAIPSGFIAANGQSLLKSEYPELAAAYGKTTSSFTVPNLNDHVLKGTTTSANAGTFVSGSQDSTALIESNIPQHSHSLSNHTHGLNAHRHTIEHSHTATTGANGGHFHTAQGYGSVYDFMNGDYANPDSNFIVRRSTNDTSIPLGDSRVRWHFAWEGTPPSVSAYGGSFTNSVSNHTHSVSVSAITTATQSGPNSGDTTGPSTANTSSVGSGASFTNIPKAAYVIWIIRATSGDNFPAGTSIYEEAREEVVTVQLESGAISTGTGKAYYRMPWAATLTGVKANCNNNVTSLVTLDVNEEGTSVLSTKLTIDNGESSSLTAATPAVISDANIANDALLTFDVDGGTGTGPLTVTLYFSRTT